MNSSRLLIVIVTLCFLLVLSVGRSVTAAEDEETYDLMKGKKRDPWENSLSKDANARKLKLKGTTQPIFVENDINASLKKFLGPPCEECEKNRKFEPLSGCERDMLSAEGALSVYAVFDQLYGKTVANSKFWNISSYVKAKVRGKSQNLEPLKGVKVKSDSGLPAPQGYHLAEVFNDATSEGFSENPTGTFAVLYVPDEIPSERPPIFSIKGTVTAQDWTKNVGLEVADYLGRLSGAITAEGRPLVEFLGKQKKLIFTGHSQGGALAQSMSYLVKERYPKVPISCVSFNPLGGRPVLSHYFENQSRNPVSPAFRNLTSRSSLSRETDKKQGGVFESVDKKIEDSIPYRAFYLPGDPVSSLYPQFGRKIAVPGELAAAGAAFLPIHPERHGMIKLHDLLSLDYRKMREFYVEELAKHERKMKNTKSPQIRFRMGSIGITLKDRIQAIDSFLKDHDCTKD